MSLAYPTNDKTMSQTSCTFHPTAKQITAERKRQKEERGSTCSTEKMREKKENYENIFNSWIFLLSYWFLKLHTVLWQDDE